MSSLESDLLQPDRVGDDAQPPEAPAEETAPAAEVPAEPDEDDDAALEAQTIALPDGDKLVRAIFDSLRGVVVKDDAQIAVHYAIKVYGERAFAFVTVRELSTLQVAA